MCRSFAVVVMISSVECWGACGLVDIFMAWCDQPIGSFTKAKLSLPLAAVIFSVAAVEYDSLSLDC